MMAMFVISVSNLFGNMIFQIA